jgi:hypothetical protein
MHPKNLASAVTDTAFDGTPVTQFRVSTLVDDALVAGLCWAFDADEAKVVARKWWRTSRVVIACEVRG